MKIRSRYSCPQDYKLISIIASWFMKKFRSNFLCKNYSCDEINYRMEVVIPRYWWEDGNVTKRWLDETLEITFSQSQSLQDLMNSGGRCTHSTFPLKLQGNKALITLNIWCYARHTNTIHAVTRENRFVVLNITPYSQIAIVSHYFPFIPNIHQLITSYINTKYLVIYNKLFKVLKQ